MKRRRDQRVLVSCAASLRGTRIPGVFCGWSGYRVDGPRVAAPCPTCGAEPDVFRRGPKPDDAPK